MVHVGYKNSLEGCVMLLKVMRILPKRFIQGVYFNHRVWRNFVKSNGLSSCSSLAYTFLLAFIPFSISIASLSSWLPISERLVFNVERYFFSQYIPQSGNQIYNFFLFSFKHTGRLSILGFISLIVTCYGMMFSVEQHIHQMWHLKRQRRIVLSLSIFTGFFIGGTVFVYTMAYFTQFILDHVESGSFLFYHIGSLSAHVVTMFSFISLYKFIPSVKVKWWHSIIAGTGASLAFIVLQLAFSASMNYLQKDYELLYGSLAMLPIFLLWLYLSVLILLLGAQVIYVLRTRPAKRKISGSVSQ